MANPTIKVQGNIAIVWGTKNAINAPNGLAGLVLDSLQLTPKNGEPVDIEDGDGLTIIQALAADGFNGKATAVYDANKALPAAGDNIQVLAPKGDGNAGTTVLNATFWSWSFSRSKKNPATVELSFTQRPGMGQ